MSSTRTPTSPADSASRLATARALATDAACAEVVAAWHERGIDSILLKGASTAHWLYEHEARGYVDADLLVDARLVMDAAEVLSELGFAPAQQHFSFHAHPWVRRSDGAVVDLHITIWGANHSPRRVWEELQAFVQPLQVGAVSVRMLSVPARGLHLALHAAQHRESPARRSDLRRALERTSISDWRQAEQLADRIRALPAMAVGLSLEPAGRQLLAHLPLVRAGLLAELDRAALAIGFARLAQAKGIRAKTSVLARAIVTDDDERGRLRLVRRLAWLVSRLPTTARSVWRARSYPSERT